MNSESLNIQFKAAYEAQSDAIFRFCLVRVSDREQAMDITQETFVRLWQSLVKGDVMTNVKSFLFTVAHRLIIDWYRKKKSLSLEALADPETGEPYDPPAEQILNDATLGAEGRFLVESISKISPGNRQAVYLRFVEGLSPPEISEVLGISANAASVRVNRGITELRTISGYDGIE